MQDTAPMQPMPEKEERTWGMLCHLSAFAGFVIPYGGIVVPLVIWLVKKDEMPFVDDQGKEILNFLINLFIASLVCWSLMFVLIGFLLMPILIVYGFVMIIVASIKANEGVCYRYPLTIRLIN